jgi:hypothetical protein
VTPDSENKTEEVKHERQVSISSAFKFIGSDSKEQQRQSAVQKKIVISDISAHQLLGSKSTPNLRMNIQQTSTRPIPEDQRI